MKPFVKNAADESQVKSAVEKEKRGRERELNDMRHILSSVQGRRFVWKLLGKCGIFTSSYSHSGSEMYFKEGHRNIGLLILNDLTDADPEAYISMMMESKKEGDNSNV